jgi:transposase
MLYLSDLKEKEWLVIKRYFEQKNIIGRALKHNRRDIINPIFYSTQSGCQ